MMVDHERLSALDATFLDLESERTPMHVCAVLILDGRPLTLPEGGVDIARIRAYVGSLLDQIPRYRQKIVRVSLLGHPVWVDDERFNLDYHVRHACLPCPGSTPLLEQLTGQIMSQKLDRTKPLWELWVVEGLASGRIALIAKVHHCLVDGVSGIDLLMKIGRLTADATVEPCRPWTPQPAPRTSRLVAEEIRRRVAAPFDLALGLRNALAEPHRSLHELGQTARGLAQAAGGGLRPASWTPLNVEIGPHRRFHWRRLDFVEVKTVARRFGATINDVVLTVVTGGLRSFLQDRGFCLQGKTLRALVPVSTRTAAQRGTLGNRVASLVTPLPVHCSDVRRRLAMIVQTTTRLKESPQVAGITLVEELADRFWPGFLTHSVNLALRRTAANVVVTNIPGPSVPVYFLGAPVLEIYPMVPLFERQALGIALFSYNGSIFWGFNADYDALADVDEIGSAVTASFDELLAASHDHRSDVYAPAIDPAVAPLAHHGLTRVADGWRLPVPGPMPWVAPPGNPARPSSGPRLA